MDGGRMNMVVFMMVISVAALQLQSSKAQTTHVVGDSLGWTIPSGNAVSYPTWASRQKFTVGDILLFNFTTNLHTVAEVTKAAVDACTTANPISLFTTGPARITLTSSGEHHFLCTIPSHCTLGQKLSINVSSAAASTPPAPAPAPKPATPPPSPTPSPVATPPTSPSPSPVATPPSSPPSPMAPTPAPTPSSSNSPPAPSSTATPPSSPPPAGVTAPPPPPNSSASFAAAAVPVTILSVAMALLY